MQPIYLYFMCFLPLAVALIVLFLERRNGALIRQIQKRKQKGETQMIILTEKKD